MACPVVTNIIHQPSQTKKIYSINTPMQMQCKVRFRSGRCRVAPWTARRMDGESRFHSRRKVKPQASSRSGQDQDQGQGQRQGQRGQGRSSMHRGPGRPGSHAQKEGPKRPKQRAPGMLMLHAHEA